MEVSVLKSLNDDVQIWRYMSLDKFINLVSSSLLYFTPLWKYMSSDPYEGFPPAIALNTMFSIGQESFNEMAAVISQLETQFPNAPEEARNNLERVKAEMANRPLQFARDSQALFKGQLVSCWHANTAESEAMWKLYSDTGKGIAVRSTVGALARALECGPEHELIYRVFIGKVRYIDYSDKTLTPKDCVVDGHLSPLLKRSSFEHEKEVRAFFLPKCDHKNLEDFKPEALSVFVNTDELIQGIYISPYADASFSSAVRVIAQTFGLEHKLDSSEILGDTEHLYAGILG